jgi:hypothetical protein
VRFKILGEAEGFERIVQCVRELPPRTQGLDESMQGISVFSRKFLDALRTERFDEDFRRDAFRKRAQLDAHRALNQIICTIQDLQQAGEAFVESIEQSQQNTETAIQAIRKQRTPL